MFRLIFNLVFTIFLVWFCGLIYFYSQIPTENDESEEAEAIVVLTGGQDRIAEGVKLLAQGKGDSLLISGVNKQSKFNELLALQGLGNAASLGLDLNKIHLGRMAVDTVSNATEAAEWINNNNIKSIILVTANYHMPRSYYEFQRVLPETEIYKHAVFSKNFNKAEWLNDKHTRNMIILEYSKLIASVFSNL